MGAEGRETHALENSGEVGREGAKRRVEAEDDDSLEVVLVVIEGGKSLLEVELGGGSLTAALDGASADDGVFACGKEAALRG